MKILSVVGARPNFVKIAPVLRAMRRHPGVTTTLVHTGQHYDSAMSTRIFADLEIDPPDHHLGVGSGSHAVQTAEVMKRLEPILDEARPDVVLVVGDVNSTMAAALTAVKRSVRVAHVEAGLRSFDRAMPEEINRIVTDAISDVLFVTEESGRVNLLREGVGAEKIHFVGNVMIDALQASRPRWERSRVFESYGIDPMKQPYAVVTLHRPANVDNPETLGRFRDALETLALHLPIVFPVHPRVRTRLTTLDDGGGATVGHSLQAKGILYLQPLGYLDFIALLSRARLALTDSGGVQEETTILGVPCLTLRDTTERPVTVTHGTNRVIGSDPGRIVAEAMAMLDVPVRRIPPPPLWDGCAAARVVTVLTETGEGRG